MCIIVKKVIVEAEPGAMLSECIKDSIKMACTEEANVVLIHNLNKHKVDYAEMVRKAQDRSVE